jgi:hypothetical protein
MEEASASMAIRMMSCSESKPNGDEILYITNNKKIPHVAKFSVLPQIPIKQEQTESKEAFKRDFETKEETVIAYNSPADRLINDKCSGENVKQMQGGRPTRQT